ncbi:MAG: hypothetical protein JWN29_1440 [Acidimicrobiales bacterium]|nr:hypothetical protein [Acidimicrobiales bacterium]
MSVIVIGKLAVDPDVMRKLWAERADDFVAIRNEAEAAGAMHHRWGIGDGYVRLLDEWPDAASFQQFFQNQPRIAELMGAAGVTAPPEFEFLDSADVPDQF